MASSNTGQSASCEKGDSLKFVIYFLRVEKIDGIRASQYFLGTQKTKRKDRPQFMIFILNTFVLFVSVSAPPQPEPRNVSDNNLVKLVASEGGTEKVAPSSRRYKAVLSNQGKDPIRLNAVQMPGGYSGDGRYFACSLQLWDRKNGKWITHRLYSFYNARSTPRIVQVQVDPGTQLEVCDGLYPSQLGHPGDCARFTLSPERGQSPVFFSNTFRIVGRTKSERSEGCKP